jgi:hypothetical protein
VCRVASYRREEKLVERPADKLEISDITVWQRLCEALRGYMRGRQPGDRQELNEKTITYQFICCLCGKNKKTPKKNIMTRDITTETELDNPDPAAPVRRDDSTLDSGDNAERRIQAQHNKRDNVDGGGEGEGVGTEIKEIKAEQEEAVAALPATTTVTMHYPGLPSPSPSSTPQRQKGAIPSDCQVPPSASSPQGSGVTDQPVVTSANSVSLPSTPPPPPRTPLPSSTPVHTTIVSTPHARSPSRKQAGLPQISVGPPHSRERPHADPPTPHPKPVEGSPEDDNKQKLEPGRPVTKQGQVGTVV